MQETFNPAPNAEGLSDSDIQLEGDTSAGNGSPGHVLDLIRRAGGMSRADIIDQDRSVPQHGGRPARYVAGGGLDLQRADDLRARSPTQPLPHPRRGGCTADRRRRSYRCAHRGHRPARPHPTRVADTARTSPSDPNSGSQKSAAYSTSSSKTSGSQQISCVASGSPCPAPWTSPALRWSARPS